MYADYLDARDAPYNIVSSATADQTAQLQAFINDCARTKLPGHIPFEGTICSYTIEWPAEDVTLIGPEGWEPPLVIQCLSETAPLFRNETNSQHFRGHLLKNLKLQGHPSLGATPNRNAIGFLVKRPIWLEEVNFAHDMILENVVFEGFATGFHMLDGFWCEMRRCRFEDNKYCGFIGWSSVSNVYKNVEIGDVPANAVGGWVLGRNFLVSQSGTAAENSGSGSILWRVGYSKDEKDPATNANFIDLDNGNPADGARICEGTFNTCHFEGAKQYFLDVRQGSTVVMEHPHFITSSNPLPAAIHFDRPSRTAFINIPNFQTKSSGSYSAYIATSGDVDQTGASLVIRPANRKGEGGIADEKIVDKVSGFSLADGTLHIERLTPGNVYDPAWWGFDASANGDTNRIALQAAIDYANSTGGGVVRVPAGVFDVSTTAWKLNDGAGSQVGATSILMKNDVTLEGHGHATVIKVEDSAYGEGALYRCISSYDTTRLANATLRNFKIDGNESGQIGGAQGSIQCSNVVLYVESNVTIENVFSHDANGGGIRILDTHSHTTGVRCSNVTIKDCIVTDANYLGIQCSYFDGIRIMNNSVRDCGNNGISLHGDDGSGNPLIGTGFTVSTNRVENCQNGILHDTIGGGTISGNTVMDCSDAGLKINSGNDASYGIVCSSNLSQGNAHGATISGDCDGILLSANHFRKNTSQGVEVSNAAHASIMGNMFELPDATTPAIELVGSSNDYIHIDRNVLHYAAGGLTEDDFVKVTAGGSGNFYGGWHQFDAVDDPTLPDLVSDMADLRIRECRLELFQANNIDASSQIIDNIPNDTIGTLHVHGFQNGVGRVYDTVPYHKLGGTLVVGTKTEQIKVSARPVTSYYASSGDLEVHFYASADNRLSVGAVFLYAGV